MWGRGVRNPRQFKLILKNLPLSIFHLEKQNEAEDYLSFLSGNTAHCNWVCQVNAPKSQVVWTGKDRHSLSTYKCGSFNAAEHSAFQMNSTGFRLVPICKTPSNTKISWITSLTLTQLSERQRIMVHVSQKGMTKAGVQRSFTYMAPPGNWAHLDEATLQFNLPCSQSG